jgi:hypothetical protein
VGQTTADFSSGLRLTGFLLHSYSWVEHTTRIFQPHGAGSVSTNNRDAQERQVVGFVGVGLDTKDGEHRITRSKHFFLVGGSSETHGQMQDTAIKFNEALKRGGKTLDETSADEVIELFFEARQ